MSLRHPVVALPIGYVCTVYILGEGLHVEGLVNRLGSLVWRVQLSCFMLWGGFGL